MTAAVAGAAARSAGGTAARSSAASTAARTPRAPTRSGRRPRPNIDERTEAAAGRFQERYSRPGAAEKKAPRERAEKPAAPTQSTVNVSLPGSVSSGAGFVLGLLFWTWVALPFLKDGPDGVKRMLRAKFTNKRPDGTYLP